MQGSFTKGMKAAMNKKKAVLQIFTSGYKESPPDFETVRKVLMPVLEKIPVEKIIMGWSVKPDIYRKTIQLAKLFGTEVYLWLPVFSETGLLKPVMRLVDDEGREVKSYQLKEGENFEFYCPNQPINLQSFFEIYEEYFSGIPFDGVFLDKIRYGAFSNEKSGVFSCFCPECRKAYEEAGIDTDELLTQMKKVREGAEEYRESPLGMTAYKHGRYSFINPIWTEFFSYKGRRIREVLEPVLDKFHCRGLKVGIDTFSPFTAFFAGQDIVSLGSKADFVKPMMYRITKAPAGLPWESKMLLEETGAAPEKFYSIIGCMPPKDEPFDLEFTKKELDFLSRSGICLYPGIEINRIPKVAETTPGYIRENVEALSQLPVEGFVLAWDMLSAPAENLEEVVRLFGWGGK